ncbi:MAG: phosphodiester glycosidase family protein [Candidatus Sericytochromatia bacterium]
MIKVYSLLFLSIFPLLSNTLEEKIVLPESLNNFKLRETLNISKSNYLKLGIYENRERIFKIVFFDPKYIQFKIQFSDKSPKSFASLSQQKNFLLGFNGITISDNKPQGDIKGEDLEFSNKPIKIYQLKNDQTAVNLRHSIGITENNEIEIVKGGIKLKNKVNRSNNAFNHDKYKFFINGASLLFNEHIFLNEKSFLIYYRMNNDKDLIKNMIPESYSPRTAIGITNDNKVVIASFSEGKYGDGIGFNAFEVYQTLKNLGCVKGLMFDGGSAASMFSEKFGFLSKPKNEYMYNSSFLTIFD